VQTGNEVAFDLQSPCPLVVTWEVFTTAYRKVYSEVVSLNGYDKAVWDLKDSKGRFVANGLYHVRFLVADKETARRKVLILK